jgi:sugar/nucleoside kinase (ribokinase family)
VTRDRTLGVIGTMVWDRIRLGDRADGPFEDWGGIAYALCALAASLPPGWSVLPILKVGADLADRAQFFMREVPGIDDAAVVVVEEPNNRVELDYTSSSRRVEQLTGGVSPWGAREVVRAAERCDALYVNFISGYEMEVEAATALRKAFRGPIYMDLHSLFLGSDAGGRRIPRRLASPEEWLSCADVVQMNEDEFSLLSDTDDPWVGVEGLIGNRSGMILVTLGERGAAYGTTPNFSSAPMSWPEQRHLVATGRAVRGSVTVGERPTLGDPTGCGDVWGATMFASLLGGAGIEEGMLRANQLASENVRHRGTSGLLQRLTAKGPAESPRPPGIQEA